jgi:HEAT repeat protein
MLYLIHSTTPYLPAPAPAPAPWQFDIVSALIGAVAALLLAGLVYRFRDAIRQSWESRVVTPLAEFLQRLQASAGDRYCELVSQWAHSRTMLAPVAPLDAVFVEPRLLAPLSPAQSVIEEESDALLTGSQVVPLHRILGNHRLLTISGAPGAGVSTLLAYAALTSAQAVAENAEVQAIPDPAGKRLPFCVILSSMNWEEDGPNIESEAKDRDENEGEDRDGDENENEAEAGSSSLPPLDQDEGEPDDEGEGQNEDKDEGRRNEKDEKSREKALPRVSSGIEGLISTTLTVVGGNRSMTGVLRQYLEAGKAIVLVDGWDELTPEQHQRAAEWLSETVDATPGTVWLVGTDLRGYAPLTEIGFVPLKLMAWNIEQVELFAKQWLSAYSVDTAEQISPAARRQLVTTLRHASRAGAPPLELTLRAFVHLVDGESPAQRSRLFDRALELSLHQKEGKTEAKKEEWLSATCRATLEQVAWTLQQEGHMAASRARIEDIIESALPPAEELPARAAARVLQVLTSGWGLLRPTSTDRYVFAHALWQAYLVSRRLDGSDPANLVERLDDPRWTEVVRFYAEIGDMKPIVAAWVRRPEDIFYTRLRALSSWLRVAPEGADWRDGTMALLARSFVKAGHPTQIRQWLAEALASTRIPGVAYLFKQALKHPDAGVRRVAVQGLTKIAEESDLPALELALADKDPTVRQAVVRGLTLLGTDAATRWLARMVVEADEMISLAAAEALAECGEEGANFLREAIEAEDTIVRRGAVYGLAHLGARDLLEKAAREDDQWIVRSAALAAIEDLDKQKVTYGIAPPPEVDQLPWLISWAAGQGEGVGLGEAARPMLWQALTEGDTSIRVAAAHVLAQIGRLDDIKPLRATLTAPDPDVVDAALTALAEISARYETRIT